MRFLHRLSVIFLSTVALTAPPRTVTLQVQNMTCGTGPIVVRKALVREHARRESMPTDACQIHCACLCGVTGLESDDDDLGGCLTNRGFEQASERFLPLDLRTECVSAPPEHISSDGEDKRGECG